MTKPLQSLPSNSKLVNKVLGWIKDPEEFITSQRLLSFPHPNPNSPGKPYAHQKQIIDHLQDGQVKLLYIGKERQCGVTKLMLAYALHKVLFAIDKHVMIVGYDQSMASRCSEIIGNMYDLVLNNNKGLVMLFPTLTARTKTLLHFSNGSTITFASAKSQHAGCGRALDLLYIDEFGMHGKDTQDNLLKRFLPCVYEGQLVVSVEFAPGPMPPVPFATCVATTVQELEKGNLDWTCVFIHRN